MKTEQFYRGEDIAMEFYAAKSADGTEQPVDLDNYDISARIYTSYTYCVKASTNPVGEDIPIVKEAGNKFHIVIPREKTRRFAAGKLKFKLIFTSLDDENTDIEVVETIEIL